MWKAFKTQARKNGKTASNVLTDFLQNYVTGGDAIASDTIEIDNLDSRIDEKIAPIRAELAELEDCQEARNDFFANGLAYLRQIQELEGKLLTPENRDRILAALEVGRQSPLYKRVRAVLDEFIREVK